MSATRSNDPILAREDNGQANLVRPDDSSKTVETKPAFKTTEFIAYLGVLASILIAGLAVDGADDFGPTKVWLYATILTVGYMVSRGIAKAGSYQPGDDPRS
jgi:hypothetical protein